MSILIWAHLIIRLALSSVRHKCAFGGVFCQREVKIYKFQFWFTSSVLFESVLQALDLNTIHKLFNFFFSTSSQFDLIPLHKLSIWFDFNSHAVHLIWIWFDSGSQSHSSYSQALYLIWFQFTCCSFDLNLVWFRFSITLFLFTSSLFDLISIHMLFIWSESGLIPVLNHSLLIHKLSIWFDFNSHAVHLIWIWFDSGSQSHSSYSLALNLNWLNLILIHMLYFS